MKLFVLLYTKRIKITQSTTDKKIEMLFHKISIPIQKTKIIKFKNLSLQCRALNYLFQGYLL
uniref:Uncharacterized protein n=1 Tax=viral metagenome TaxID=1070528 RepID=A0A6C0E5I3_9ZZZZ